MLVRPLRSVRASAAFFAAGTWLVIIALWGYVPYRLGDGVRDVAIVLTAAMAGAIPALLFGGVLVDRFGPRAVLVSVNTGCSVAVLLLLPVDTIAPVAIVGAAYGGMAAVGESAYPAFVPRLVPESRWLRTTASIDVLLSAGLLVGPLLAAATIALWDLNGAWLAAAMLHLLAAMAILTVSVRGPVPGRSHDRHPLADLRDGLRLVVRTPAAARALRVVSVTYFFWGGVAVLEPAYVAEVLGESETVFAVLQAAFGVVLVSTGLVVARRGARVDLYTVSLAGFAGAVFGAVYLGTPFLVVAFLGVMAWGAAVGVFRPVSITLLLKSVPEEAHGRILGVNAALDSVFGVLVLPIGAWLAAALGVQAAALILATVTGIVYAVMAVRARRLRRSERVGVDEGEHQGEDQREPAPSGAAAAVVE